MQMKWPLIAALVLLAGCARTPPPTQPPAQAQAAPPADPCSGHRQLSKPRPADSCKSVASTAYAAPDSTLLVLVVPADKSLSATPDSESRVEFRDAAGKLLAAKDYSSPQGDDGYYLVKGAWTPDSDYFVYSITSSGGHEPWSFPTAVYSRHGNLVRYVDAMIGGKPNLSPDFTIVAPHTLNTTTWKEAGRIDAAMPVSVDLKTGAVK
jgi:hypothetical protein